MVIREDSNGRRLGRHIPIHPNLDPSLEHVIAVIAVPSIRRLIVADVLPIQKVAKGVLPTLACGHNLYLERMPLIQSKRPLDVLPKMSHIRSGVTVRMAMRSEMAVFAVVAYLCIPGASSSQSM